MKLPKHFHVFEGSLYNDRRSKSVPIRENYSRGHREIRTVIELKSAIRYGKYTDLGGYPLYFITSDGCALSFDTVRSEFRSIVQAIKWNESNGWKVVGCDINYEDNDLTDEHTGEPIESAYGE